MVNIFDDEAEEVGSEIEAYCPKCKADTVHLINSKFEDEIRRVQCNSCLDIHAFRKPRGDADEEPPEPVSVKKKAAKVKPTWEQMMAKASKKTPKLYVVAEQFHENDVISHPKFGVGYVSDAIGLDKIEITFREEKRVLIHNRRDISLPPAAYAHPVDATASMPVIDGKKKAGAKVPALPAAKNGAAKVEGKKPETKKPETKKPETKKPETKKVEGKKPVAKKPEAKKSEAKKPEAKKPEAKKPEAKKPEAKKPEAKKPVAKKPEAKKKPTARRPEVKKPAAKKSEKAKPVKKTAAKKATKPAAKKPAAKPSKKPAPKKAAPSAKASKKPAAKAKGGDKKGKKK